MHTNILFILILTINIMACKTTNPPDSKVLEAIDIEFSNYSKQNGFQAAFLKYCAEEAVLLENNSFPIKGIQQIETKYTKNPDSNLLTWKPLHATISASGDLGYTYGTWEYTVLTGKSKGKKSVGCYVTIWQKQNDGSWKFILDSGTSGLP